jgi:hypothetical protein
MGYLQRIVNGGGYVEREYGIGRGRIDLLAAGLAQLDGYLEQLGLATGVLVVFDRRPAAPPIAERTRFAEATTPAGRAATILRA